MFDNCKEISSLWHDSSSFNRLVAKVMNPRCMCRVLKSCGVCGEWWPHFQTHTHTHTLELNSQTELGFDLHWLDVLGFRERRSRCWWLNLSLCAQMSPSSANTSRHIHTSTHNTSHALICTRSHKKTASKPHTYSSALSVLLLSYLIIHMLNSHKDFVINWSMEAGKVNMWVRLDPNMDKCFSTSLLVHRLAATLSVS